ncbi:hypothetical protein RJ641_013053, partial [Dillenia turbinata]
VLDAQDESGPRANYDSWMAYIPEGEFLSRIGPTEFLEVDLEKYASPNAMCECRNFCLCYAVVYMFAKWYKPGCTLEYPLDGSGAVADALVRGMQKFCGRISLKSHVERIAVENGQAVEVRLRSHQGICEDLGIHHIVVNDWERGVDADQNVVLIAEVPKYKKLNAECSEKGEGGHLQVIFKLTKC